MPIVVELLMHDADDACTGDEFVSAIASISKIHDELYHRSAAVIKFIIVCNFLPRVKFVTIWMALVLIWCRCKTS